MKGKPRRMNHPKETVKVGGVGDPSQEWRNHSPLRPGLESCSAKELGIPGAPEPTADTSWKSRKEGSLTGWDRETLGETWIQTGSGQSTLSTLECSSGGNGQT